MTSQQTSQAPIQITVGMAVVTEQWMGKSTRTIMLVEHVHTQKMDDTLGGEWIWGKWSL